MRRARPRGPSIARPDGRCPNHDPAATGTIINPIELWHELRWQASSRPLVAALVVVLTLAVLTAAGALGWWHLAGPQRFEPLVLDEAGAAPPATAPAAPSPASAPSPGASPVPWPADTASPMPAAAPSPAPAPEPTPPQVWLLVSTGTGVLSAQEAEAMRMPDGTSRAGDRLTDTIMLAVLDPDTHRTALLSIPRDTWNFQRGHRVNATYALHGMQALVDDVRELTGLPVHHVVGVNMRGFVRVVDAAGGVVVATDRDLRDTKSHLPHLPPGCWLLDGPDALAYVRSRHTKTLRDGRWVVDAESSDFGRTLRQREVLASLWEQLRGPELLGILPTAAQVAGQDLTLDQGTSLGDLVALARAAQDVSAQGLETHRLPTYGRNIAGAAAQVVDDDAAAPILARLRRWTEADAPQPPDPAPDEDPADPAPATSPSPTPQPSASPTPPPPSADRSETVARLDPATCSPQRPPWHD